jgi:hypothetical protein
MSDKCRNCDGTGRIFCRNSHIIVDGYRRERCGVCGGTGKSRYLIEARDVRFQREAREQTKAWGALRPPEGIARQLAPALYR